MALNKETQLPVLKGMAIAASLQLYGHSVGIWQLEHIYNGLSILWSHNHHLQPS